MKDKKTSRHRYFQLFLSLGLSLSGSKSNFWIKQKHNSRVMDILGIFDFVSQLKLEKTLYNLRIEDRSRRMYLEDFDGQLEQDSQGSPFWNVYLQTNALTSSRSIAKSVSKELFQTKNSVDSKVEVRPLNQFQRCQREKLFSIPNSKFYPGFFSRTILTFLELLRTDQVKEFIQETPDLIDQINKLDEVQNT